MGVDQPSKLDGARPAHLTPPASYIPHRQTASPQSSQTLSDPRPSHLVQGSKNAPASPSGPLDLPPSSPRASENSLSNSPCIISPFNAGEFWLVRWPATPKQQQHCCTTSNQQDELQQQHARRPLLWSAHHNRGTSDSSTNSSSSALLNHHHPPSAVWRLTVVPSENLTLLNQRRKSTEALPSNTKAPLDLYPPPPMYVRKSVSMPKIILDPLTRTSRTGTGEVLSSEHPSEAGTRIEGGNRDGEELPSGVGAQREEQGEGDNRLASGEVEEGRIVLSEALAESLTVDGEEEGKDDEDEEWEVRRKKRLLRQALGVEGEKMSDISLAFAEARLKKQLGRTPSEIPNLGAVVAKSLSDDDPSQSASAETLNPPAGLVKSFKKTSVQQRQLSSASERVREEASYPVSMTALSLAPAPRRRSRWQFLGCFRG